MTVVSYFTHLKIEAQFGLLLSMNVLKGLKTGAAHRMSSTLRNTVLELHKLDLYCMSHVMLVQTFKERRSAKRKAGREEAVVHTFALMPVV